MGCIKFIIGCMLIVIAASLGWWVLSIVFTLAILVFSAIVSLFTRH